MPLTLLPPNNCGQKLSAKRWQPVGHLSPNEPTKFGASYRHYTLTNSYDWWLRTSSWSLATPSSHSRHDITSPSHPNQITCNLQAAEIQADLQAYLTDNDINSLFVSIVVNVLLRKPTNPIAFIINFLQKEHPKSASESSQSSLGALRRWKFSGGTIYCCHDTTIYLICHIL